jgi:transposase
MPPDREQILLEENASLRAKVAEQSALIERLQQAVDTLSRRIFGKSSEKLDPNQLEFVLGQLTRPAALPPPAAPADLAPPARRAAANNKRGPRIPDNLPVSREEHIDPPEVAANPQDFRRIGEEVTERVAYTPGSFSRVREIRGKYVAIGDPVAKPIIAPQPPCLQERCIADPSLIAEIIYNRFVLHLPYYRQAEMFATMGAGFHRKTLCDWALLGSDTLSIIYRAIQNEHWRCRYRQLDETPIRYLKPGTGKALLGYLWTSNIPGGSVFFHWHAGRDAAGLDALFDTEEPVIPADISDEELEEFVRIIQCDAYQVYRTRAEKRRWLKLMGCHAHVRRKFFDAADQAPGLVGWILRQFALLYQIEERLREAKAGPALRQAVRAAESRMIHQRLHKAITRLAARNILPRTNLGKAIHYALGQWSDLRVFLEDGRVEIDNNLIENAIRPTKLGHKNWLFVGSEESGEKCAILYTIVENCRRLKIDVRAYLSDVLARLPGMLAKDAAALTPAAWLAARSGKALRPAA